MRRKETDAFIPLIVTGDLIHVAGVQFDDPTVTISFDSDGNAAAAARDRVFTRAAREGTLIAAAHLQFPGMGRLKVYGKDGSSCR